MPIGTLNQKTLTVAFMEFLSNSDSNSMKSLWLKHGFRDISPIWGNQANVPTFATSPSMIAQWPQFQEEMTGVEADWYYLSGHHGREFASDFSGGGVTLLEHVNSQFYVGFFNEPYHMGPWRRASVNDPKAGESSLDVYMTTSGDDWVYDLGPQDNPLYNAPHTNCKGVLLVGCNTLVYKQDRIMLNKYFPNALIMGLMSGENNSIRKIVKTSHGYGRKLFTNPESIDPVELVNKLNPQLAIIDRMGVMKNGMLYYPRVDGVEQIPADANLKNVV